MKRLLIVLTMALAVSVLFISCAKKPLTLDDKTSMKTLLKASDEDITDLVVREAQKKYSYLSAEDINVEYILRDKENQTLVVKIGTYY